ncbi:unnamed protein product [Aureobasidium mustum]|uniref:SsDNA binding protein n=1 Tax=Aureobasidium mustum TaxID=2773714 RepID=A0A9N8K659_9PEZI|nr:unnamed protein product [Aureobasidium mustum]
MFAARSVPRALNGARAFSTSPAHALARMQIIGRLADQPELTPTSTGREMVRYALGVKSGPKNENGERQTSWFRVASFSEGPGRDADARMDTFQTQDGSTQTRLNLVQRKTRLGPNETYMNRPDSDRSAAEEPSSGLGAS